VLSTLSDLPKTYSLSALLKLYFSLFNCHLIYAIGIWSYVPSSVLQPLITKQKAAIIIISNKKCNEYTEPIFKALSIVPLQDLITSFNLKFFHSYAFNYIPTSFSNTSQNVGQSRDNPNYQLCNDDEYYIPRHRTIQDALF
jgi:hypothetical protein